MSCPVVPDICSSKRPTPDKYLWWIPGGGHCDLPGGHYHLWLADGLVSVDASDSIGLVESQLLPEPNFGVSIQIKRATGTLL